MFPPSVVRGYMSPASCGSVIEFDDYSTLDTMKKVYHPGPQGFYLTGPYPLGDTVVQDGKRLGSVAGQGTILPHGAKFIAQDGSVWSSFRFDIHPKLGSKHKVNPREPLVASEDQTAVIRKAIATRAVKIRMQDGFGSVVFDGSVPLAQTKTIDGHAWRVAVYPLDKDGKRLCYVSGSGKVFEIHMNHPWTKETL